MGETRPAYRHLYRGPDGWTHCIGPHGCDRTPDSPDGTRTEIVPAEEFDPAAQVCCPDCDWTLGP